MDQDIKCLYIATIPSLRQFCIPLNKANLCLYM